MSQGASIWLVIGLAVVLANLPFITQRLFGLIALPQPKSVGIRLGELMLGYFVTGGVGLLLERRAGQIAPQGWEFYAVTAALFVTLAFPGFVFRYLVRHRG